MGAPGAPGPPELLRPCFYISFNTTLTPLNKSLTENCLTENYGPAIINLVLEVGVRWILGSFLFSSSTSKLNLLSRNLM